MTEDGAKQRGVVCVIGIVFVSINPNTPKSGKEKDEAILFLALVDILGVDA